MPLLIPIGAAVAGWFGGTWTSGGFQWLFWLAVLAIVAFVAYQFWG